MNYKSIVFSFFSLFIFSTSFGQFIDDPRGPQELYNRFVFFTKRLNMKFKFPKGMVEVEIKFSPYTPHQYAGGLDGMFYQVKPKYNDDLRVVFALHDLENTPLDSILNGYVSRSFARKLNYLLDTRPWFEEKNGIVTKIERSDVLDSSKMEIYKGRELKKYGSDCAGMLDIPLETPYLGKYHKLKVLFMLMKTEGEAYLYYFYNDGVDINKYVDLTKYSWTFK
ncbi:hypothetical protein [Pedobacter sp. B4-66]|uniref:hypothetical protein n=1 Tax=Pedobacter sp. B4-66 TaxID=2817280 RepID=UPI001BDAE9AD|nr:hypothetical protein [Pedobacter sp. B4-66]